MQYEPAELLLRQTHEATTSCGMDQKCGLCIRRSRLTAQIGAGQPGQSCRKLADFT